MRIYQAGCARIHTWCHCRLPSSVSTIHYITTQHVVVHYMSAFTMYFVKLLFAAICLAHLCQGGSHIYTRQRSLDGTFTPQGAVVLAGGAGATWASCALACTANNSCKGVFYDGHTCTMATFVPRITQPAQLTTNPNSRFYLKGKYSGMFSSMDSFALQHAT